MTIINGKNGLRTVLSRETLVPLSIVVALLMFSFTVGGAYKQLTEAVRNNTEAINSLSKSILTRDEFGRFADDLRDLNPGMNVPRVR